VCFFPLFSLLSAGQRPRSTWCSLVAPFKPFATLCSFALQVDEPASTVDFGTVCQLTQESTDGINESHKDEEVSLSVSAFAVTGH
jgi:hypothetical protein